jgi:hypothetical protein
MCFVGTLLLNGLKRMDFKRERNYPFVGNKQVNSKGKEIIHLLAINRMVNQKQTTGNKDFYFLFFLLSLF